MATLVVKGGTQTYVGLNTYNHTAAATSLYTIEVRCTEVPTSTLSIVIKNNSSTLATSATPAAGQNNINLRAQVNCTLNDVIGVVVTSSSPIDQQLNNVQTTITIRQGL